MKILHSMVAIVGVSLVCVCLIVIRADDPETAYDESEIPVAVAIPVTIGIPVNPLVTANSGWSTNARVLPKNQIPHSAKNRRERLCTFLC